ncbi:MAG: LysR family transcriptional regulator [Bdellovibrio sp.]|nr:LysR family transcriptional regulator [Bdellovibrio sp.]
MMIETSQLQTLVAVARAKSFSRAAEDLNVTQSAISQSIKNLETKIEVGLFKRAGKKIMLTPEGEKLYALAAQFLESMDETIEEIRHDKATMSGKVRIGTLTGVGKSWLAPELLGLAQKYPELTVCITLGLQEDLVREFKNNRLDILVLPEDSIPPVGEKVFLSEEKSTMVFPKSKDFSISKNISVIELAKYPTVLFEIGDPLYFNWCRARFGEVPKKINVKYVVNGHGNMLQAVSQGLGVAVIPNHVLRRSYYQDKVATLGKEFEVSNGKFFIVYHKESKSLLRIQNTIKLLLSSDNPLAVGLS